MTAPYRRIQVDTEVVQCACQEAPVRGHSVPLNAYGLPYVETRVAIAACPVARVSFYRWIKRSGDPKLDDDVLDTALTRIEQRKEPAAP
ncbi:hypothetical protein D3C72_830080 [compost metagenome]